MRRKRLSLLALALLLAACASAPDPAGSLPQGRYLHRLQTARDVYNTTQQAVATAAESGFISRAQKARIDPFGRAAEQSLRAAVAALRVWNASGDGGDREELVAALVKLETAGAALLLEWNKAQGGGP